MAGSFSTNSELTAKSLWDFTRCVRPNGTAYGTSGQCRQGVEKQKPPRPEGEQEKQEREKELFGYLLKKRYDDQPERKEKALRRYEQNEKLAEKLRESDDGKTEVLAAYAGVSMTRRLSNFDEVSLDFDGRTVSFKANGEFDYGTIEDSRDRVKAVLEVRRMFRDLTRSLRPGTVLEATAWGEDGREEQRTRAYEKIGFVSAPDGLLRARVSESGGLEASPSFSESMGSLREWYVALFGFIPEENFSEAFIDFTRCVRPDGSAYGSRGACRKGVEQALSDNEKVALKVMRDTSIKSDRKRISEMVRLGVPKDTDFVALVSNTKKKIGLSPTDSITTSSIKPKKSESPGAEKRLYIGKNAGDLTREQLNRILLDPRIKPHQAKKVRELLREKGLTPEEKSQKKEHIQTIQKAYKVTTLAQLNKDIDQWESALRKNPKLRSEATMNGLIALRAIRREVSRAEKEKEKSLSSSQKALIENSPKYKETPGSSKPAPRPDKKEVILRLEREIEKQEKQLDDLFGTRQASSIKASLEKLKGRLEEARQGKLPDEIAAPPLGRAYEIQKFNSRPEVVARRSDLESRDDILRSPDGRPIVAFRGVTEEKFAEQFRGGGPQGDLHYPGGGIYGNGSYAAAASYKKGTVSGFNADPNPLRAQDTAISYTGARENLNGKVTAFAFRKDANIRIFDNWDRNSEFRLIQEAETKTGYKANDAGTAATLLGIHAFNVNQPGGEDYWVVLNRGAIVVATDPQIEVSQ